MSIFQVELLAIYRAFQHASNTRDTNITILSNSPSSLKALSQTNLTDNVYLLTSIYKEIHSLSMANNTIKLDWLTVHVGPLRQRKGRENRSDCKAAHRPRYENSTQPRPMRRFFGPSYLT